MTYYIIRHKKTGEWLPNPGMRVSHRSNGRYDNSRVKARTHVKLTKDYPPRLFRKHSHATQALHWWLQGEWYLNSFPGTYFNPPESCIYVRKIVERIPTDLEIVEVVICELERLENDCRR